MEFEVYPCDYPEGDYLWDLCVKCPKVVNSSRREPHLASTPPSITLGLYLPLTPTLFSSFPPTPLSFPPTHFHCLFPRWMVLLIFTFSPVNEEAVIITDCSPDPEGKCAHSDWLWMVSSVAKVSPGSLLISQSPGSFSWAQAYLLMEFPLHHSNQSIPTKLLFCICIVFML